MTLNELTYSIFETIRSEISDDDNIDIRQIRDDIHKQRALWLRNELNKNRTIHPDIQQDLGCVDMELTDNAECCEITTGCNILRSVEILPRPLELHNKEAITRVGPVNKMNKPFSLVPYERAIYSGNGKFNYNKIFAFYLNWRIYITGKDPIINTIEKIHVRGVFENPEEAGKFVDCDNKPCFTADSEYPIMEWLRPYIETEIIKKYIPQYNYPSDAGNDNNDRMQQNIVQ